MAVVGAGLGFCGFHLGLSGWLVLRAGHLLLLLNAGKCCVYGRGIQPLVLLKQLFY